MSESGFKVHAMELGPMLNFVYLVEDISSRRCAVVDPAWEVEDIVNRAAELDLNITDTSIKRDAIDTIGCN